MAKFCRFLFMVDIHGGFYENWWLIKQNERE